MEDDTIGVARALRRTVLGDAYVDQATSDLSASDAQFQDWVTSTAWGVWARGEPFSTRDRSLLVMAMTAALGRMDEFRLHASSSSRAGVSDEEVDELMYQIGAYCGMPAAVSAKRVVKAIRAERGGTR
jgi:4-carboxymuconolactone decarboxylase